MNRIDLHVHTTASDGIYSPAALIQKAEKEGLSVIAIADHDTVDGIDEAQGAASEIRVIPAIEFSVDFKKGTFHLVGMNIDHTYTPLVKKTAELRELRDTRIERILDDLAIHDINIEIDEVLREAAGGAPGRPHVARCLVRRGYAPSITEIFQNYLVEGKPGYATKDKISLADAVNLILDAGGIPVIAHPVSLEREGNELKKVIEEFIGLGGQGIEVYASMHDDAAVQYYHGIAQEYSLLISGGSDFHGDKDEILGFYQHDKPVPADLYLQFV